VALGGCAELGGDKRSVVRVNGGKVGVGDGGEREDEDGGDAGAEQGAVSEGDLG
jgi:hypothetical protein